MKSILDTWNVVTKYLFFENEKNSYTKSTVLLQTHLHFYIENNFFFQKNLTVDYVRE